MLALLVKDAISRKDGQPQQVKPAFEDLSPDLQWHICQRRERLETCVQLGAIVLVGLLTAPVLIPGINRQLDITLHEGRQFKLFGMTVYESEPALEALGILPPEVLQPVQESEMIAGYPVTSGYGPRQSPCLGCSSDHKGIDLGTPVGTPIYAPAAQRSRVKVECWTDSGGGGLVADISSPDIPDIKFQALHLSECATGLHPGGSIIARTGATGNGTGPHLDWRQRDKITDEHQPPQKGYLQWVLTGSKPRTFKEINATAIPLTDSLIKCAIGSAEGTVHDDCSPNSHYFGHVDPGNGAANLGVFSYQHGATTPQEADRKQLENLKSQIPSYQAQSQEKFGADLSKAALLAVLDLHNQAPEAAQDFIDHLPNAAPTPQEIIDARAASFINPATGSLDAPGLGNTWDGVKADQERRTGALLDSLSDRQHQPPSR